MQRKVIKSKIKPVISTEEHRKQMDRARRIRESMVVHCCES